MRDDYGELLRFDPVELRYGENLLAFRDIRHSPEDARLGSYNTECYVKVVSGEFAGLGGWECDWKDIFQFTKDLEKMCQFQLHEVEFRDIDWGNWLKFILHKTGQIEVAGLLRGRDGGAHTLTFEFRIDQTVLKPFLHQLKQLCQTLNARHDRAI